jgi:hypothetical protein
MKISELISGLDVSNLDAKTIDRLAHLFKLLEKADDNPYRLKGCLSTEDIAEYNILTREVKITNKKTMSHEYNVGVVRGLATPELPYTDFRYGVMHRYVSDLAKYPFPIYTQEYVLALTKEPCPKAIRTLTDDEGILHVWVKNCYHTDIIPSCYNRKSNVKDLTLEEAHELFLVRPEQS